MQSNRYQEMRTFLLEKCNLYRENWIHRKYVTVAENILKDLELLEKVYVSNDNDTKLERSY